MVILDTNIIIDFLKGRERVITELNRYPASELAITFVNHYELLKYRNRERLDAALENLTVFQSNTLAIRASANAYKLLKGRGKLISDNDLLIFGVCVANNEMLLTQDKAFENLQDDRVIVINND